MIKRDYILNMIEQLIQRLQLLTGLIKMEEWSGALDLLDETMEEFFGWRSDFVNAMSDESLLALLGGSDGRLDVDGVTLLAVLLKAEGDVYAARGDEQRAYFRYLKALHLFLAANEGERDRTVPPEWDHTVGTAQALSAYELPVDTSGRLFYYLLDHESWSSAEDLLWEVGEHDEVDQHAWQAEGEKFYESLIHLDDEALQRANMSRQEVRVGLAEWRVRLGDGSAQNAWGFGEVG